MVTRMQVIYWLKSVYKCIDWNLIKELTGFFILNSYYSKFCYLDFKIILLVHFSKEFNHLKY